MEPILEARDSGTPQSESFIEPIIEAIIHIHIED